MRSQNVDVKLISQNSQTLIKRDNLCIFKSTDIEFVLLRHVDNRKRVCVSSSGTFRLA